LLLSLHKSASNSTWVFVTYFVHLDCIVSAVEWNNKSSGLIIRLGTDERRLETKNVHVLFEHLLHVCLGRLRLQMIYWSKGVFGSSETVVGGNLCVSYGGSGFSELYWFLFNTHILSVPCFGEGITIEN
jgi:hypothetical protein